MPDSPALLLSASHRSASHRSARLAARVVSRHLPQRAAHADVTALVWATLDDLRRSEAELETQLCDLRVYLGAAGVCMSSPSLA